MTARPHALTCGQPGAPVRLALALGLTLVACRTTPPRAAEPAMPAVSAVQAAPAPAAGPERDYAPVTAALTALVEHEMADKQIPGLSIALVDDQRIVWAHGFGYENPADSTPATAATVYRVGSVSKLFTDIGVMQLVERGQLDLDAPVSRYLPEFAPRNTTGKPITLRQLMAHRSGLVREPPAGNYFDSSGTSLAATVRSLNETALVYAPETRAKYSNAGIATVGYVLERTTGEPFASYLKRAVLAPMGLTASSFEPESSITRHLAAARMWSYDRREFSAPTFQLGMAPAGSMYTTVEELGRFLGVLFAGGRAGSGQVIRPETLDQMWTPQFAPPGERTGFGLGFAMSELEGRRRFAHGGAIYGFSTELQGLPREKLGVVVTTTMDGSNAVTTRVADAALRLMLAASEKRPLPAIEAPVALAPERARELAGRYGVGERAVDLVEQAGTLYLVPARGGFRATLHARHPTGDTLVTDDRLDYGTRVLPVRTDVAIGGDTLRRMKTAKPTPAPNEWHGLIGEYGWDYNTLYVLERDGRLTALIEWFYEYPLTRVSDDVYAFPDWGLYAGERMVFTRDTRERASQVVAANVRFPRRALGPEDGSQFTITPLRPIAELRATALAARPPAESGSFRASDLVELAPLDPTIKLDIRYATTNNFMGAPFYSAPRAFLQRPAAAALLRAHQSLRDAGYGLLIHDAYRPWYVTKMFWDGTPSDKHIFVADPSQGSRHNRGAAVDLTLYDLRAGKPIESTGGYDELTNRSYPFYPGGTSLQRWHRDLLRRAMESQGFTVYEAEWWHFDYGAWRQYRIGTATFEQLKPRAARERQ